MQRKRNAIIFPFLWQQELEGHEKVATVTFAITFSLSDTSITLFFLTNQRAMTQTTLDFSPTFQRHHTTPIIIMLSLTFLHHHHHHHYLLKATITSFITNIIIIIHHLLLVFHHHLLHHHNQEPSLHTKQGHKQTQEQVDKVKKQCLLIMLMSKP